MKTNTIIILLACIVAAATAPTATAAIDARIKDIATVQGVRDNQLIGYGLVVGLDDTGDDSRFTRQSVESFLNRMGVTVESDRDIRTDNVAAVVVTAELPPFAREGSRIDVTVSCVGDADSLQGGTLLLTPLRGADGEVYAVAQGSISIGGFNYRTGRGDSAQRNHPTAGRIPGGAVIEQEVDSPFTHRNHVYLLLRTPDFTTAGNIAAAIDDHYSRDMATALDSGTVDVDLSAIFEYAVEPVALLGEIENLRVASDSPARVVINERTGTVVAGQNVRISTVAITHAGINVEIVSTPIISQPPSFARRGDTVETEDREINVSEEESTFRVLETGATIGDLVQGLNNFGVTSARDVIAIFQALKEAGALNAELVIM